MSIFDDCGVLPDHVEQECNDYRKGGISAIAIISPTAVIPDFTSATDWQDAINAGQVSIIGNVKATYPKANASMGENALACGSEKILDGFDYTLTWKDFNVNPGNDAFYASLNQQFAYVAIYYCNESEIRVFTPPQLINFACSEANGPESNRDKQMYECSAMWFAAVGFYSQLFTAPVGIFE